MRGRYLQDWILMRPPDGGEPQIVGAQNAEEISRLSYQGWSQCEPTPEQVLANEGPTKEE